MFIKQIIEFELRRWGPPDHTCTVTSKTDYFYGKTQISQVNSLSDL